MSKYFLLILSLIVLGCNEKPKQLENKKEIDLSEIIEPVAKEMIEKPLINSTSIAIFYDGKEYIGHYGEIEKGKNNKPNNETIYEIGSLSKVITGTLVAKAVLEGKIDVEDSVNKYLDKKYTNLSYQNQPVKIKHLLTHTSTLPNMLPLELNPVLDDFVNYDTPSKIHQVLENYDKNSFLKDLDSIKVTSQLGEKYSYSSAGVELMAHLLEQVYKKDYEQLLTEFLSTEIGMNNTKVNVDAKDIVVGYHVDNPNITLPMGKLPWGAAGNIKSTVPDMLGFIKYQLKNDKTVQESHRTLFKADSTNELAYFWEIDLSDKELGKYYLHHGGVPRSQCYIFIVPKHNLGAFIITNQSGTETAKAMIETMDKIFNTILKEE
ncbi:serine hydrolase domain-containing protein [Bernardetia sp.]|uniref:serine hydrolase domain-containing protein n=1 Tax=Bernardetia sp. TaxID=1937974 RepID=UPI0025BE7AF5|nr:serine hydrolase domain-containing protein [Bernardetia sp.]